MCLSSIHIFIHPFSLFISSLYAINVAFPWMTLTLGRENYYGKCGAAYDLMSAVFEDIFSLKVLKWIFVKNKHERALRNRNEGQNIANSVLRQKGFLFIQTFLLSQEKLLICFCLNDFWFSIQSDIRAFIYFQIFFGGELEHYMDIWYTIRYNDSVSMVNWNGTFALLMKRLCFFGVFFDFWKE